MAVYLVAYKINTVGSSPEQVVEAIKKVGTGWMHYIPNTILITSNETADVIGKKIFKLITTSDYVLVIRVTKQYYGWLPQRAWDWLNNDVNYD